MDRATGNKFSIVIAALLIAIGIGFAGWKISTRPQYVELQHSQLGNMIVRFDSTSESPCVVSHSLPRTADVEEAFRVFGYEYCK